MAWTLTSALARAARRAGVAVAAPPLRTAGSVPATMFQRSAKRRVAGWSAADKKAYVVAVESVDRHGPDLLARAVASGAPLRAVVGLALVWRALTEEQRAALAEPAGSIEPGPLTWNGIRAVQVDGTTCGAASMAVMLMATDPFVALWVVTGRTVSGYAPPEVAAARIGLLGGGRWGKGAGDLRWRSLQRVIHRRATRRAVLGIFPWPRSLGTPPWRVDSATRCAGLRFRGVVVDDADTATAATLREYATYAITDGIPVPMYVAGDSRTGLSTAFPRHVVLLTKRVEGGFMVYEPSSGAIHRFDDEQWGPGGPARAALGNWTRVAWLVLPRPR